MTTTGFSSNKAFTLAILVLKRMGKAYSIDWKQKRITVL